MAKVTPSSINRNDYNPTFSPTTCPSVVTATGSDAVEWLAPATPLPPSPNNALCECEMSQLQCVSTSNDATTYADDFGYICGNTAGACNGTNSNITVGSYGAFGMCSPQQKLSYDMNKYYQAQSGAAKSSACDFSGRASLRSTSSPTGSCVSLLQAAGTNGQGTVPQPTGNSAAQGGSGSGGSSSGVAAGMRIPAIDTGLMTMGAYIVVAIASGAGMILL